LCLPFRDPDALSVEDAAESWRLRWFEDVLGGIGGVPRGSGALERVRLWPDDGAAVELTGDACVEGG